MEKFSEESIMVMEKARPTLDALSQLAPDLNKATDLYMAELNEIEEQLDKLNLGIEVELSDWIRVTNRYNEENDNGETIGIFYKAWTLGYGRYYHDWCLLVREYKVDSENEQEEPVREGTRRLLDASRDLRLAAAEKIPDLLKEIEKQVKQKIEVLAKVSDKH